MARNRVEVKGRRGNNKVAAEVEEEEEKHNTGATPSSITTSTYTSAANKGKLLKADDDIKEVKTAAATATQVLVTHSGVNRSRGFKSSSIFYVVRRTAPFLCICLFKSSSSKGFLKRKKVEIFSYITVQFFQAIKKLGHLFSHFISKQFLFGFSLLCFDIALLMILLLIFNCSLFSLV